MPLVIVGPPRAHRAPPVWTEHTAVFRDPSGRVLAEDGWRYGTLIVHPTLPGDLTKGMPAVTVTHLPTLLAVLRVNDADDAMRAAEKLWSDAGDALVAKDADAVRARVSTAVREWIEATNRSKHGNPLASTRSEVA